MMQKTKFPKCPEDLYDCAGYHNGACEILNDTNFKTKDGEPKPCPFYITRREKEDAERKRLERLESLGIPVRKCGVYDP